MLKLLLISMVWVVSVVMLSHFLDLWLSITICLLMFGIVILLSARHIKIFRWIPWLFFISMLLTLVSIEAKNDRNWWQSLDRLANIEISTAQVKIDNLRNFNWRSLRESDQSWESREYDLNKLNSLDLIIEPFNDSEYMAHTMLSFGFEGQGHIVVSVEARKETHEEYSLISGALRQFELIYIFGDERDLFGLRAVQREAKLYLYPIQADQHFIQNLFRQLVNSANGLQNKPQFYKTVRSNCTTTLVEHIDQNLAQKIGLRYQTLFPALAGELLYELGYISTQKSFAEVKIASRIDHAVRKYIKEPNFSAKIRE